MHSSLKFLVAVLARNVVESLLRWYEEKVKPKILRVEEGVICMLTKRENSCLEDLSEFAYEETEYEKY